MFLAEPDDRFINMRDLSFSLEILLVSRLKASELFQKPMPYFVTSLNLGLCRRGRINSYW